MSTPLETGTRQHEQATQVVLLHLPDSLEDFPIDRHVNLPPRRSESLRTDDRRDANPTAE
ncbi:MAG: hypothetical protein QNJ71_04025 [Acidimicrobiia bacterium]|nr:hypothetical protein [Acidimicrobiia bacterium]